MTFRPRRFGSSPELGDESARPTAPELRRGEVATWGAQPDHEAAQRRRMRLVSWKRIGKRSLRGFATVELPIGPQLIDCPVFVGKNGAWASLPAKPDIDKDSSQRIGADSKPSYSPALEWRQPRPR